MNSSLDIQVRLSRPAVPATHYLDQPLYALLDLVPGQDAAGTARVPFNLAIVVDSSATMHNFQLNDQERDFWQSLAIARDEMERGEADERTAIYWSGQTLADMQEIVHKPMTAAVNAIKTVLQTLQPQDRITVIAFADRVHVVFSAQDWATFPEQCISQLDLLAQQRLPVDIGNGTHMSEALTLAAQALSESPSPRQISRLMILSDGIVQDTETTTLTVAGLQQQGIPITTIGLGEEFDEEFLTRIADASHGEYHYAADSAEIAQRLNDEMSTLQSITITDLQVAIRGLDGTMVQDIAMVRPSMALFDEVYTEDEWTRARVGDISGAAPTGLLLQLAPTLGPEGERGVAEVQMTWAGDANEAGKTAQQLILVEFTDDPQRLAATDPEVADLVDRFQIYKYEREAQRAAERGDVAGAQEKLGAATRALREIGEDELAADMEGQMAELGGATANPSRVKRIKATTRRLGGVKPPNTTNTLP